MNMIQTRLYSTQTRKNRIGFVSCSRVASNFISPGHNTKACVCSYIMCMCLFLSVTIPRFVSPLKECVFFSKSLSQGLCLVNNEYLPFSLSHNPKVETSLLRSIPVESLYT